MADRVPLVVSGEVNATQPSILMTIVDSTPYYLVTDIAGIPYFQPLFQDSNTGLEVFTQFAARVTVAVGSRAGSNSVVIANLKPPFTGDFLANPLTFKIVAPSSIPNAVAIIPIEKISYKNPNLIACGYEYVIDGGYSFFVTTNWSATPNTQAIASVQQEDPAKGFYVFPVDGLVDSHGNPATVSTFSALYNDVLGKTAETFLFTNRDAWRVGAGQPYYYCADGNCGPNCFGTCARGQSSNCNRIKNGTFECIIGVSTACKVIAVLPIMVPMILCMIAFFIVFFGSKYNIRRSLPHGGSIPGPPEKHYILNRKTKLLLCALIAIISLLLIALLILVCIDDSGPNEYLRRICKITGDYQ